MAFKNDTPTSTQKIVRQESLGSNSSVVKTEGRRFTRSTIEGLLESYGFEVIDATRVIPVLRFIKPENCDKIFSDWLSIARSYDPKTIPLRNVPKKLWDNFTLNGYAYVKDWYFGKPSNTGNRQLHWPEMMIEQNIKAKNFTAAYAPEGEAVHFATKYHSIKGLTGIVIGSLTPWVEVICLRNGAKNVLTAEYQVIQTNHPQLGYVHPITLAENLTKYKGKFDFAVLFSSTEHSGIGRYGHPLDPIGDLREMQKVRCLLKDNGLMFLGVPTGRDGLYWNAHRVYGRIRLAMMFAGYKLLEIFYGTGEMPYQMTFQYLISRKQRQFVFVLQKI